MAYYRDNRAVIEGGETEEELEEFFDYLTNVVNKKNLENFRKAAGNRAIFMEKILDSMEAELELERNKPTIN